jgi:hypothetical protein
VFAVFEDDVHGTGEASESAGAGVWHYFDVELKGAMGHCAAVLEDEGTGAAWECAGHAFDRDISAGTLHRGTSGEHFAFAGCVEIAVELFVDGHAAEGIIFGFEGRIEGSGFHFERSGGVPGHGGVPSCGVGRRRSGLRVREYKNGGDQAETSDDTRGSEQSVTHASAPFRENHFAPRPVELQRCRSGLNAAVAPIERRQARRGGERE